LRTHFATKREKGVGTAFSAHYIPIPCTLACKRSTFYQHSQFLKCPLVQRKNENMKEPRKEI